MPRLKGTLCTPNYWGMSRILCSFPGELLHREYDAGGNAARCEGVRMLRTLRAAQQDE
jgi:hypothetical protein